MYSFEGDFRRKPQQNLAGASSRQNMSRDALLLKAQQERSKREDQRKRLNSTIKIQAYVRSFLIRMRCKQYERTQFDTCVQQNSIPNELQLIVLIRRLLFFYDQPKDSSRLIFISQQLLRQWTKVLKSCGSYLQIRRLLALHLKLLNSQKTQGRDSLAVPLRMLEVFTSIDSAKTIMEEETANTEISETFLYLIKRGYFKEIRLILENKTPSLYGPSSNPPTPLAASLFDLMQRPFLFVDESHIPEYSHTVMFEFASSMLSTNMSEVIRMFVLPALCAQSSFPYASLVWCLGSPGSLDSNLIYSSWLLYSILLLQPQNFVQSVCGPQKNRVNNPNYFSNPQILNYLAVMARLTSTLCCRHRMPSDDFYSQNSQAGCDADSDSDTEEDLSTQSQVEVNNQCIDMLNNSNSAILYICSQTGQNEWNEDVLEHISGICHNLLLSHKLAFHKFKLLFTLAFKPSFLRALWSWSSNLEISSSASPSTSFGIVNTSGGSPAGRGGTLLAMLAQGMGAKAARLLPPLATFCSLYSLLLATLHDEEFGESDTAPVTGESSNSISLVQAFSFSELGPLCVLLRQVCTGLIELAFPEQRLNVGQDYRSAVFASTTSEQDRGLSDRYPNQTAIWAHLFKVAVRLLRQLHLRDQRLHFTNGERDWCGGGGGLALPLLTERPHHLLHPRRHQRLRHYRPFAAFTALTREDCEEGPPLTTKEVRTLTILKEIPFVVPFSQRVLIFQGLLLRDKQEHQGDLVSFLQGPNIHVMIRRSHIYEDAFDKLSPQNEPDLRLKMRVQLMNEAGLEEAGVDGGGVFREFLSELLRTACDPNRGFFRLTRDNTLYPNPAVHLLVENFQQHYYFIGRMLGKALYEGLLVDLPLAEFFLQALVGEGGGEADIHRLAALDERLHRSLLQLRALPPAAVPDLGLDFTVMSDELGEQRVEELKPGGSTIAVTAENRIEYIHLMAEWKLSRQVRLQTAAAKQGMAGVVPLAWLRLFGPKELRLLVSGAESAVDVEDLKLHTNYGGGYSLEHPTIKYFWKVVENFTDIQKRQLLKFVTSCSRPPLLGFKDLDPPFCVQHAGSSERLPSASTCMNLLKLPEFPSEVMLKEKLLYAINAGAGFELS